MKLRTRTTALALTAASVTIATTLSAAPSHAFEAIWMYEHTGYNGYSIAVGSGESNLWWDRGFGDMASAVRNVSSVAYVLYDDTGYSDRRYCIRAGESISNLARRLPMETRLRMLLVLAGLPEPRVNLTIRDVDGEPVRRSTSAGRRARSSSSTTAGTTWSARSSGRSTWPAGRRSTTTAGGSWWWSPAGSTGTPGRRWTGSGACSGRGGSRACRPSVAGVAPHFPGHASYL